jgi:hypothetical protein
LGAGPPPLLVTDLWRRMSREKRRQPTHRTARSTTTAATGCPGRSRLPRAPVGRAPVRRHLPVRQGAPRRPRGVPVTARALAVLLHAALRRSARRRRVLADVARALELSVADVGRLRARPGLPTGGTAGLRPRADRLDALLSGPPAGPAVQGQPWVISDGRVRAAQTHTWVGTVPLLPTASRCSRSTSCSAPGPARPSDARPGGGGGAPGAAGRDRRPGRHVCSAGALARLLRRAVRRAESIGAAPAELTTARAGSGRHTKRVRAVGRCLSWLDQLVSQLNRATPRRV